MTNRLPALTSLSSVRPLVPCRCGCGGSTQRTFVPGHDSRLKGLIVRVIRDVMTLDQVAEWGGPGTRKAVEAAMKDRALMKRWNIEAPAAEQKVG